MTSIADGSRTSGRAETMGVWFVVKKTLRKPQFWFGFTMIVPLLIWYWIFSFWPIIQAFRMSTVAYKLLDPGNSPFVGLGNFIKISQHPLFWVSVKNTILWAVYSFIFNLPLAMLIAVFLS